MREGRWDHIMHEQAGDVQTRGHHVMDELMGNGMRVLSGDGVDMDDRATPTLDTRIRWVF